jgi:hypothetical protein
MLWVLGEVFVKRDSTVRRAYSRQGERGTAIYEAVIATPLFLLLIFAAIQFMVLAWRNLAVQFVATQVLRSVVTGQCGGTAENPDYCAELAPAQRLERIRLEAMSRATALGSGYGLGIVADDPNFRVCIEPIADAVAPCAESTGIQGLAAMAPGQLWEVSIFHESPIIGGIINFILGGGAVGYGATATNGSTTDPRFGLEGRAVGRVEIVDYND